MSVIRYELFTDVAGQWRFRVKAPNGEVIATSEGYSKRVDAEDTVKMLVRAMDEDDAPVPPVPESSGTG